MSEAGKLILTKIIVITCIAMPLMFAAQWVFFEWVMP